MLGFCAIIAAFLIASWARAHSPHMGFGEMITKMDSYILKEPFYNLAMAVSVLGGLVGFVALILGVIFFANAVLTDTKPKG